jgi:hypothetical protein
VFPYNIFTYCSTCRVDCKFARNKLTKMHDTCKAIPVNPSYNKYINIHSNTAYTFQHQRLRLQSQLLTVCINNVGTSPVQSLGSRIYWSYQRLGSLQPNATEEYTHTLWGTIYQQLSINAERRQFPHSQILTPDDDLFGRNISRKSFKVTSF